MIRRKLVRLIAGFAVVCSGFAHASQEVVPLQEKAQGQALTGAGLLNDAIFSNPAAASFTQAYAVEGAFYMGRGMAVSILDTKTSSVGGGIGYYRMPSDVGSKMTQGVKGILVGRISDVLGIGVGGKMIWGQTAFGNPAKMTDVDTGLFAVFSPVTLGFSVRNVFSGSSQLRESREWSAGASIDYEQTLFLSVAAKADWRKLNPYQYGIGFNYVSPYYFSLKGGYRMLPNPWDSYWSTGLSFLSPKFSLHYSVEFPNREGVDIEHALGATILL